MGQGKSLLNERLIVGLVVGIDIQVVLKVGIGLVKGIQGVNRVLGVGRVTATLETTLDMKGVLIIVIGTEIIETMIDQ